MKKRATKNYVNNKELLESMIRYKALCKEVEEKAIAERQNSPVEYPRIPNYIGECLYLIATKLANRPNFYSYTYKDDMICDGLENAVQCVRNFNPEKSNNPFAYFTQVIWFAFLRRIEKEKKQLYIKHKVTEQSMIMGTAIEKSENSDSGDASYIDLNNDYMNNFVSNYEKRIEKNKEDTKKRKIGLERAFAETDEE